MRRYFPRTRVGAADYLVASSCAAICFALFMHSDITRSGWDSLQYLFGNPLDFYDNAQKLHSERVLFTNYQPPIYVVFALWLYPLKLIGLIDTPERFPIYLAYWLKTLTTGAYIATGLVFYRIALNYASSNEWAKYATAAWMATPLAVFSQFIFSQADIFYVLATLTTILMVLRNRLYTASLLAGFAITFKYFPLFVFLPLLLLHEKRIGRILLCLVIVAAPTALFQILYNGSPAYAEGVKSYLVLERIYVASLDTGVSGSWRIHLLIASFAILCGFAYFSDMSQELRSKWTAYFWLCGSILPFIFIVWHPQWLIFITPAVVLTSMISRKRDQFLLFDIVGMFLFVGSVALRFQYNVDAVMFRGSWPSFDFNETYPMSTLFDWFGDHSHNVFLSAFWGYLALQLVLKYKFLFTEPSSPDVQHINYDSVRRLFCLGLLIFLLPAAFSIYRSALGKEFFVGNIYDSANKLEILNTHRYEQTLIAKGTAIKQVSLLLATTNRENADELSVEILDDNGVRLRKAQKTVAASGEIAWHHFEVGTIPVSEGSEYRIRIGSAAGRAGDAFKLFSSHDDMYKDGRAFVDGASDGTDLVFKVVFVRQ